MTYQVLARKCRPRNLEQMIGQEHIIRLLTNALTQQRLHHAYLLTGTRGVGKTTLARILTKCLNCETGITATPCGTCNHCSALDNGRFLDLFEIDAASRTKVEDTRELLENVHYPPSQGRYKIYLIDEVHMLSGHSFNALLKTLEEPPPYVKFLLATTEPKRLPITVLSRCLQLHLKRIPSVQITRHLENICAGDAISYELPALELLAQTADGSLRDALSLLDQAIAYAGEKITQSDTREMLGCIEEPILYRILDALANRAAKPLFEAIAELSNLAVDFHQALGEIVSILHRINLFQLVKNGPEEEQIVALTSRFTPEEVQLYYQIALIGRRDLPFAPYPQQGFEMVLLRMLAFQPITQESNPPPLPTDSVKKSVIINKIEEKTEPPVVATALSSPPIEEPWAVMLPKLELTGMAYALASHAVLTHRVGDTVALAVSSQHQPLYNNKLAYRIEQALSRYLNKKITLTISFTTVTEDTPIKQQQQTEMARQSAADAAIKNDHHVQKIMNLFDATLSSVTAIHTTDEPLMIK